jgi:hypothetical protein
MKKYRYYSHVKIEIIPLTTFNLSCIAFYYVPKHSPQKILLDRIWSTLGEERFAILNWWYGEVN